MMSSTERPAKRARLEADKRRDALAKVQDKYADIDFTRFQKDEATEGDTSRAYSGRAPVLQKNTSW